MGIFSKLKKKRALIEDKVKNDIAAEVARMRKEMEKDVKTADVSPTIPNIEENITEPDKPLDLKVEGAKVTQATDAASAMADIKKDASLNKQEQERNEELGIKKVEVDNTEDE